LFEITINIFNLTALFFTTIGNVFDAVMTVFDYGIVLTIVFTGAALMLGHRSKAIELLIVVACGYLLGRKAVDIRDFFKSIKLSFFCGCAR